MRPDGIGRVRVRSMSASVSRSITWLRTLAPAATRPVPASATARTRVHGEAVDAVTKPTSAVNTTIAVIRGLASSTQSAAVARESGTVGELMGVRAVYRPGGGGATGGSGGVGGSVPGSA